MQPTEARSVFVTVARIVWHLLRFPLLALLTLFEPVVRAVLSFAMVLGVLAATVFELSAAGPRFEFLQMFAGSLGLGAAQFAYHGLQALLSR
jgi:small-conductance mechanosensitive channel